MSRTLCTASEETDICLDSRQTHHTPTRPSACSKRVK